MKLPRPASKRPRIEIIPMIDAIFFLLVFFMLSSLSMVHVRGLGIALPRPAQATAQEPERVIVTVTAAGDYYLNETASSARGLARALRTQLTAHPDAVVVVNIAKSRTTRELIRVMDAVNSITLPSGQPPTIVIATEPMKVRERRE